MLSMTNLVTPELLAGLSAAGGAALMALAAWFKKLAETKPVNQESGASGAALVELRDPLIKELRDHRDILIEIRTLLRAQE